jgi:CheY-like chemotaxis protein
MPIRVALVEDQRRTREGLAVPISGSPAFQVAGQYGSMEEALPAIEGELPDVVLAAISLPGMSGIEGVRRIHRRFPELPILMLTVHGDDESVFATVCVGACGPCAGILVCGRTRIRARADPGALPGRAEALPPRVSGREGCQGNAKPVREESPHRTAQEDIQPAAGDRASWGGSQL